MERRALLAVVLTFVVMVAWQRLFLPEPRQVGPAPAEVTAPASAPTAVPEVGAQSPEAEVAPVDLPVVQHEVRTDL